MAPRNLTRRDFLRLAGIGTGSLLFTTAWRRLNQVGLPQTPLAERIGRVCVGKVDLKLRPDELSETVGVLYEDALVPWLREAVGPKPYYINQRWVETPDGYVYAPYVQQVKNLPNQPVSQLQQTALGEGMWAEVTVPYADLELHVQPSSNSWIAGLIEIGFPPRVYYQMVFWVDRIRTNDQGQVQYRVNPNYYGGVDLFWVPAEAMRPLTAEDVSPINPDAANKRILVDVIHQTLTCYEGNTEVYFCRISTGAKFDAYGNPVDKWSTPIGKHKVQRKFLSLQMSGGTTGAGYDLPGIGWTSIFATGGVAIHSTFWHNDFGVPRSHGCVNALPDDARWIFRWSAPHVPYQEGLRDISLTGEQGTAVEVVEA